MSYGKTGDDRKRAAKQHLLTVHTCKCGREVRGNAYHRHRVACAVWKEWRQEQVKTIRRDAAILRMVGME